MRVVAPSSPEATFRYAEALFFAGLTDSAAALYNIVSKDPKSPWSGPSLDRLYLIEDGGPRGSIEAFGRLAYERWRGEPKRASLLADSLYRALPRGPLWAR